MRLRQISYVLPLLALCACARNTLATPPAACAKLIPEEWAKPVPPEPIPDGNTANDWAAAYVGQTGQLAKANGRASDAIGIMSRCEAMVNAARK